MFDDLLQLSSIKNRQIFHFSVWKIFVSLFLKRFKRHDNDSEFERLLKTVRFEKITNEIMNIFHRRKQKFRIDDFTHKYISFHFRKDEMLRFNALLLKRVCNSSVIVHKTQNRKRDKNLLESIHKHLVKKSNLLNEVIIVSEVRMMFLKNNFIIRDIINDNYELIIKINDRNYFIVAFSMIERIKIKIFSCSLQRD